MLFISQVLSFLPSAATLALAVLQGSPRVPCIECW